MSSRQLTRHEMLTIARGIADGRDTTALAGEIGVDRSTLRGWLAGADFLRRVARSLSSPADMGEAALANLRAADQLDGEREASWRTRRKFRQIVEATFPDFFAAERAEAERAAEEKRRIERAAERAAEKESRAEAEREKIVAECAAADFFNLQTLCAVCARNWKDGTADELAQGLDTAEKRRAHRCAHGLKWDCAGFGVYYEPTWSAARCKMEYDGEDGVPFDELATAARYQRAWREIEGKNGVKTLEAYLHDPFRRRDPRLPTKTAEAEALLRKIASGADFLQATRPTICPAEVAGRNKKKGSK